MMIKMMKRLLSAALAAMLLLSPVLPAAAETYPFTGIVISGATLRRGEGSNAEPVANLPAGEAVYVTGESGSYYIVEYEGVPGFIPKSSVTTGTSNLPTDAQAVRYAALYQGNEGQLVSDLQKALIELKFLSGKADGKYGPKTGEAVAAFQQANGLNAPGYADAATQGLLYEGQPKNAKGSRQTVTVVPTIEGFPVSSGKTGELVSRIQSSLKVLNYYTGKIDGRYGASTVTAVKTFQSKNGLKVTGVCDADSQAILFGSNARDASATATPKPTATPVPDVKGWENGKAPGAAYPFNAATTDAVNLRKKASIHAERILTVPKGAEVTVLSMNGDFLQVTYQTRSKEYTGYVMTAYVDIPAVYLGGKELAEDAEAQKKYTSMSQGASGTAVSALQEALQELGFYSGAAGGVFDAATVTALKLFQRGNGLLQTGVASPEVQKLIFEGRPLNANGTRVDVAVLPPVDDVTMRSGDKGYQVTELQQALKSLGYFLGTVNGVFDTATFVAVKAFQQARGLTVDGVAGPKVLAAIRSIFEPTQAPVIPAVASTSTPAPVTAENVVVLRRGTRGLAVTRLQTRLVELGYYSITPDGIYDEDDIEAVRAFQQKNGLTVDGVAGLETQMHLYSASAIAANGAAATATEAPEADSTLRIGSSGNQVNLLQARLTTLKYFTDTIDGLYGTKTAAAVAAFQKDNKLTADGVAGPQTLKAIYSSSAKAAAAPTAAPSGTGTGTAAAALSTGDVLHVGSSGSAVRSVQKSLIALGYMRGTADGIYGTKTYQAVKSFQKDNNLTVDGMVGQATLARIEAAAKKVSITSGSQAATFKRPSASEVRFVDWYNETRAQAKLMPDAIIYDYKTGLYYNVHMFSFGKHCDAEPITESDTAIMYQVVGENVWTPHAVWVILSDGKVYMASTHSHGHDVDTIADNGLTGHICIHFPREMTAEEKNTMPYALSHQKEILRGWEETQAMIN